MVGEPLALGNASAVLLRNEIFKSFGKIVLQTDSLLLLILLFLHTVGCAISSEAGLSCLATISGLLSPIPQKKRSNQVRLPASKTTVYV